MNPKPTMSQGAPNANTSIQHLYTMGLHIAQNVCSVVTAPIEYALRPFFGTRYFDPIQTICSWALMLALAAVGMTAGALPFTSPSAATGLYGLGTLALLFFTGQAAHGPRIWMRMIQMEWEQHSEYEGDALPFFARLPYGDRFWIVRIIWEPLLVAVLSVSLHLVLILDRPATLYLFVGAVALSIKNFLCWYQQWLQLRMLMDAKFAGPLMAKAAAGTATEKELAQVHLAGFPKNIPAEIRTAAIYEMTPRTAVLPPEISQLISPVEPDAPRAA